MDVVSHGLWGTLLFGHNKKGEYRYYFWAALFGILPDTLFFFVFIGMVIAGNTQLTMPPNFPAEAIETYKYTHSFLTAGTVFIFLFIFHKNMIKLFLAWPLHITVDIFTHTADFYPTKFLYPLSDFYISVISWRHNLIAVGINYVILIAAIVFLFIYKKKKNQQTQGWQNQNP